MARVRRYRGDHTAAPRETAKISACSIAWVASAKPSSVIQDYLFDEQFDFNDQPTAPLNDSLSTFVDALKTSPSSDFDGSNDEATAVASSAIEDITESYRTLVDDIETLGFEPAATVRIETDDGPVTETTDIEVLDPSGSIEQADARLAELAEQIRSTDVG